MKSRSVKQSRIPSSGNDPSKIIRAIKREWARAQKLGLISGDLPVIMRQVPRLIARISCLNTKIVIRWARR